MSESLRGNALIRATRPYAVDNPKRSLWYLVSTFVLLEAALTVAVFDLPWWVRLTASVLAGLVIVRAFTIYHDHQHHAILRDSKLVNAFMKIFGILVLAPSNVWRQTHNHHHTHNARLHGSHIGSFEVLTVESWNEANRSKKFFYWLFRHPITIVFGYVTVFIGGFCISPLFRNARRHWDSGLALFVHVLILVGLTIGLGFSAALYCVILPLGVASALGAYLFYIQHNFVGVKYHARDEWEYAEAAMESSSYLASSRLMAWFTGNIGYHHVHHLNPLVPFYRLPEAMAEIEELQNPPTTTLKLRDVIANFRLNLWDPVTNRMVRYRAAKEAKKQSVRPREAIARPLPAVPEPKDLSLPSVPLTNRVP